MDKDYGKRVVTSGMMGSPPVASLGPPRPPLNPQQ